MTGDPDASQATTQSHSNEPGTTPSEENSSSLRDGCDQSAETVNVHDSQQPSLISIASSVSTIVGRL